MLQQEQADRDAAIKELERGLAAELAKLRARFDEFERDATIVDARGLPVVGFGIVLSGVPEYIGRPPVLGWLLPVVGVLVTIWACMQTLRAFRTGRVQTERVPSRRT